MNGIPIETYYIETVVNGSPELQICKVDEQCYGLWWKDGHRCFLEGCRCYDSVEEAERAIRSYYGWFADKTNEFKNI